MKEIADEDNSILYGINFFSHAHGSSGWATDSLLVSRVGTCLTGEQAYAVALAGNYAYIANDDSGIRVIDISNLATPSLPVDTTIQSALREQIIGHKDYLFAILFI